MSFATCALIPPESVEIALDALYTIDINADPDKYGVKAKDESEAEKARTLMDLKAMNA